MQTPTLMPEEQVEFFNTFLDRASSQPQNLYDLEGDCLGERAENPELETWRETAQKM
jgi:hypothetical protein